MSPYSITISAHQWGFLFLLEDNIHVLLLVSITSNLPWMLFEYQTWVISVWDKSSLSEIIWHLEKWLFHQNGNWIKFERKNWIYKANFAIAQIPLQDEDTNPNSISEKYEPHRKLFWSKYFQNYLMWCWEFFSCVLEKVIEYVFDWKFGALWH